MTHPASRFGRGRRTLVAFVVAFPVLTVALNALETTAVGGGIPGFDGFRVAAGMTVLAVVAVALLRLEDVPVAAVGLQRRLATPGLAAVAAVWVVLNAAAFVLAARAGVQPVLGSPYDLTLAGFAGTLVVQYVFVAVAEELALRGFLQNKLVAVLGGPSSTRNRALGVLLMGATFGLLHVPDRLVTDGLAPGPLVGSVLAVALSGVAFGVIYDLTRNLYLVVGLHGTGNFYPLVVDTLALPDDAQVAFEVVRILAYVGVVVAYRQWGPSVIDRADSSTATAAETS